MEVLTESGLVAEVAVGTFAFKNKIAPGSLKLLWDKLARFVADALKQQKGVLLPNLGTFTVGPVVGETRKKVRPAFALLDTRYASVSQERPRYAVGGRCPVLQPNYGLLATASAVHRGICQRLVLELMQRLGAAVLANRPISVYFPSVGRLFTNKANRVQFEFDHLLREYFELERERVIAEMEYGKDDRRPASRSRGEQPLEEEPVPRLVKGLQQVHLHNPPNIQDNSRPATGASASPSARLRRQAHAPYKGVLLELWRLCKSNDRINSGCVSRLQLEQWLQRECGAALRNVAASTVLELLSVNTYGKTGKHILYKPFLDQLECAVGDVSPVELSPQNVQSPRRVVDVLVESPTGAQLRQAQLERRLEWEQEQMRDQQEQGYQRGYEQGYQQAYQQQQDHQGDGGQDVANVTFSPATGGGSGQFRPPALALPVTPGMPITPGMPGPQGWAGGATPQPQGGGWDSGGTPDLSAPASEPPMPHHYYQNHLMPHSRLEYDNFNRVHFDKLQQARGQDYKHRAVTPKVGEDELNRREYHAVRQMGDGMPPEVVLGLPVESPYSRATPQPIVSATRQRGSPGPRPQIMTLAHEPPPASPPPPAQPVPGLPGHFYQLRPASARQPTPSLAATPNQQPGQSRAPPTPQLFQQQQGMQQQQPPQRQQSMPGSASGLPPRGMTPQRGAMPPAPLPQQRGSTPQHRAYPAWESPREDTPPISQYEIINEADPVLRQRKRAELANALQNTYAEQIREKDRVRKDLEVAEARWPYVTGGQPQDKRPSSAVSRPASQWGPYDER
ncbi:hypothetical protein HXX76_004484 [Chlamydomonas incerta]|uniref:CCDC81 HU domain-containing protein n=1 Tax=Chlamydomonas incerta TaxID=51695 RepID=A0A835T7R2_CHLIN|nr:hypothetical protein HXX76_004484 [Chlamydomonas incerta]|eukprot:KAG2440379.1 hypothetical protein HXX76_004484 [Chlamydomonas incerta]